MRDRKVPNGKLRDGKCIVERCIVEGQIQLRGIEWVKLGGAVVGEKETTSGHRWASEKTDGSPHLCPSKLLDPCARFSFKPLLPTLTSQTRRQ